MRPSFLDDMSWAMAEVYGAVTDRLLVNLAHYFPYINASDEISGSFEYQARMLARVGQVNKESVDIITQSLGGADAALRRVLEETIMDSLKGEEPKLQRAAKQGLLRGGASTPAEVSASQMNAFKAYYRQSADKLNLVNTVMLESTQAAYTATVSDIANKIQRTQSILNVGAGEVVTGVSSWNQAVRTSVRKMIDNGLTGFIDHAGRRWSPETYVAMDIRTTMYNTARSAIWERADDYGCDTYQVSSHNGARPLCYPWQGKVISRTDMVREVEDLDGNKVHVYAQSETSYGQVAGLFGVNCHHYPMTFIPGFSTLKGEPQDEEENAKTYEESQQQRALERKLREERRDLAVMKAQGASPEEIRAQKERVKKASQDIEDFCDETGRTRRKNREGTPINAKFPNKDSYDPKEFPTAERDKMNEWFRNGGNDNPPPSPTNIHLGPDNVPPQGQAQIPIVQKAPESSFVPAKTREEAEEYAQKFLYSTKYGQVSYKGIDLEYANTCNRVLSEVNDKYQLRDKLQGIEPMNMRTNRFKGSTAEAAYNWGGYGSLYINPTYYKTKKALSEHVTQITELTKTCLDGGQKMLDTGKFTGAKKDWLEALLSTKRQCVSQSYDFVEGTFVHECGHMLDDKVFRASYEEFFGVKKIQMSEKLSESRRKYGKNISAYAIADNQEYIAESFTAWWYGETAILDPVIVRMFEGTMKQ